MEPTTEFLVDAQRLLRQSIQSLFQALESQCEGSVAVDHDARIVWINDKYRVLLGIPDNQDAPSAHVEELPHTPLPRHVIRTGKPILLDIMEWQHRDFVVTRIPLVDDAGNVTGAVGFVLYDTIEPLTHLIGKFNQLQTQLAKKERELALHRRAKYSFSQVLGNSAAIQETKRQARRAAPLDSTVLLQGETGTGKELLAQAIHAASPRAERPFVGVNVAAIPEALLESEFFGAAPGAYTGADRKGRKGKFELAHGGTLFLDEIGDMPLALQVKLLRALQEKEIEPLGSNRIIKVDVRIVTATSADLEHAVQEGRFRADLYYRLKVVPIRLPPLRERLDDLPALCERFLEQIALRNHDKLRELDESAITALASYHWPGNIRELLNILEQVCALTDTAQLSAADFSRLLPASSFPESNVASVSRVRPLAEMVAELERSAIESALSATNGKKTAAAKMLGISRAKLYERLAEFGLMPEKQTTNA